VLPLAEFGCIRQPVREQVGVYDANRYDNVVVNFLFPRRRISISTFIMVIIEYAKLLHKVSGSGPR
jgi:hypothetical protein